MTEASNGGNMLSGSGANFKTISEAKSFHVGLSSIKGDYFSTVVTPVMFQKDKASLILSSISLYFVLVLSLTKPKFHK